MVCSGLNLTCAAAFWWFFLRGMVAPAILNMTLVKIAISPTGRFLTTFKVAGNGFRVAIFSTWHYCQKGLKKMQELNQKTDFVDFEDEPTCSCCTHADWEVHKKYSGLISNWKEMGFRQFDVEESEKTPVLVFTDEPFYDAVHLVQDSKGQTTVYFCQGDGCSSCVSMGEPEITALMAVFNIMTDMVEFLVLQCEESPLSLYWQIQEALEGEELPRLLILGHRGSKVCGKFSKARALQ